MLLLQFFKKSIQSTTTYGNSKYWKLSFIICFRRN